MKKNSHPTISALLKWLSLFAVVFALSLPASQEDCQASPNTYQVSVSKGYLALRNQRSYDSSNEIGQLYNGELVEVTDYTDSSYWLVYSSKLGQYGFVNKDYLVYAGSYNSTWTVSVPEGYLALRTQKSFDSSNEIGSLYTGDLVEVSDSSDPTYWYVYAPKLGQYGYVNKNYLISSISVWNVNVNQGYLALRTAKSFDSKNEIGELYNEDSVLLYDSSDPTYWYVYSPKYGTYGFVNKDYLYSPAFVETSTVSVSQGYLALRTAKSYDASNEIGELYSGDVVELIDTSDSEYWYVYSASLGLYGYVNKNYLY